jgi:hypothetical protein
MDAFNAGHLVVNYNGHGSVVRWARESIFEIWDVPSLNNIDRLPLVFNMSCANGYFVFPSGYFNCMAEELIYSPDGGAVAVVAPGGMSYPDQQEFFDKGAFESIFTDGNYTVGPAVTKGKMNLYENAGETGRNVIQTFPLFGDPALELKRE